jgi:hypothetical protein
MKRQLWVRSGQTDSRWNDWSEDVVQWTPKRSAGGPGSSEHQVVPQSFDRDSQALL